ncbi:MAG: hypothetical protein L3K05_03910, partial [Thermoplasmata archaeon]|nr:hypothetical protein [Thermoplasmata archaeon]
SFTMSFGLSLADIEVPAETLYAENRTRIDPIARRRMFAADPVTLQVEGFPADLISVTLPNHPERQELGDRTLPLSGSFLLARSDVVAHAGETIRLKDLANVELPATIPDSGPVAGTFAGRENRRVPRLQWIPEGHSVSVDLLDLQGQHLVGVAEAALRDAAPGEVLQFERFGFVRTEDDWTPRSSPVRVCYGHP